MVGSKRIDACQPPDRLMEVGHVGSESRFGVYRGSASATLSSGEMVNRKSALPVWMRKCFVSTVAHRGVIIIRNNRGLDSGQGLRSGGPGTQVDRLSAESPFPKIPSSWAGKVGRQKEVSRRLGQASLGLGFLVAEIGRGLRDWEHGSLSHCTVGDKRRGGKIWFSHMPFLKM